MNEQLWTTFKAVAELGAISRAARQLNLSVSAVSQQISQLEQEYQCRLFVRTGRGVTLTETGEVVYRYVVSLLNTLAESRREVEHLSQHRERALAIGASFTAAEYLLPRVLPHFQSDEDARVSVAMANSQAIMDLVIQGEVAVGLIEAPLAHAGLVVEPFCTDRLAIMVGSGHPWAEKTEISLEEFLGAPVILREPGSGTRMTLESSLAAIGFGLENLQVRMVLGTTQAIKAMVAAGVGVSAMSPLVVSEDERKRFHALTVEGLDLYRSFSVVHPVEVSTAVHRFVAVIRRWPWASLTPRWP